MFCMHGMFWSTQQGGLLQKLLSCMTSSPDLTAPPEHFKKVLCVSQALHVLEHIAGRSCVQKLQSCMTSSRQPTVLPCARTSTARAPAAETSTASLRMAYMKSGVSPLNQLFYLVCPWAGVKSGVLPPQSTNVHSVSLGVHEVRCVTTHSMNVHFMSLGMHEVRNDTNQSN